MPGTRLNPYLSFRGQAREAMTYYQSIFGGELTMNTFAEFGMVQDPAEAEHVMHSQLAGGEVEFMAADVPAHMDYEEGARISMSLFGQDDATLSGYFEKLTADGTTSVPLANAPWGSKFGMCVDKFGIAWMVNIDPQ